MKHSNTFVKYLNDHGKEILITLDDIITSGNPMSEFTDDQLELVDDRIYRGDGTVIE